MFMVTWGGDGLLKKVIMGMTCHQCTIPLMSRVELLLRINIILNFVTLITLWVFNKAPFIRLVKTRRKLFYNLIYENYNVAMGKHIIASYCIDLADIVVLTYPCYSHICTFWIDYIFNWIGKFVLEFSLRNLGFYDHLFLCDGLFSQ